MNFSKLLIAATILSTCLEITSCGSQTTPTTSGTAPVIAHVLVLFAGNIGGKGTANGEGASASFYHPQKVATDASGNIYVTDNGNSTIRKISPAGMVTTIAGNSGNAGFANGTGSNANFNNPQGIIIDASNNIYVADTGNNAFRKVTQSGIVTTEAQSTSFNSLAGLGADSFGNVYIADTLNYLIRQFSSLNVIANMAGTGTSGSTNGAGASASFNQPKGVAADSAGHLYVADTGNNTIRKITLFTLGVTTYAGTTGTAGSTDGASALFNAPSEVALDSSGNVYVADTGNNTIRRISTAGATSTLAGSAGTAGTTDGTGTAALFNTPTGIALDPSGNVYVADSLNDTIRKITPSGKTTTFAGTPDIHGTTDGTNSGALFNTPGGLACDSSDNIYVADTANSLIRKVTSTGVSTTLSGSYNQPNGVALDSSGNIYVADTGNSVIKKITSDGVVSTIAGTAGVTGSTDGAAALFNHPNSLFVDSTGNVYVADTGNNKIRLIHTSGVVSTFAGSGIAGATDGTGTSALFNQPTGIAMNSSGNLYIVDQVGNTIREITPSQVVSTVVGNPTGSGSTDGIGTAARFNSPTTITIDSLDNMYVVDKENSEIRKIVKTTASVWTVTTFAGVALNAANILGALPGSLSFPRGITADSSNNIYVTTNNGIIKIIP